MDNFVLLIFVIIDLYGDFNCYDYTSRWLY